jgi:hypothetical protein
MNLVFDVSDILDIGRPVTFVIVSHLFNYEVNSWNGERYL